MLDDRVMSVRPKISVVMPSYDRGHTIGEALDTVLAQTFQDFELIVVDEHSTDSTAEVLADRQARHRGRIEVIRARAGNVARARNLGLEAARGDYVVYCDSDDAQLPTRLAAQAAVLDAAPEVALVFVDSFIWENGERVTHDSLLRDRWLGPTDHAFDEDLARHFARHDTAAALGVPGVSPDVRVWRGRIDGWLCASHVAWGHSQMYRAAIVRAAGGHWDRLRCYEDWELSSKLSKHHDLAFLDAPLVKYRVKHQQLTGTPRPNAECYVDNLLHTWWADRVFYRKHQATIDRALATGFSILGEVEARDGNFAEAEACFRRAALEGPGAGKLALLNLALSTLKHRVPALRGGPIGGRIPAVWGLHGRG